jgi:hypothetical protein
LNEEFDWQIENLEQVNKVSGECEEITFEDVKAAIKKAKSGRAPEPKWLCG